MACTALGGVRRAAFDGEDVGGVVVHNARPGQFVAQGAGAVAAQLALADQPYQIGLAVVFDALGLAFDEFVRGARGSVALLPEKGALAGLGRDHAMLVAISALTHLQARAAQHDGAFGHDDMAGEHRGLLQLVMAQCVGLDVHGLVAIGLFGMGAGQQGQPAGRQQRCQAGR